MSPRRRRLNKKDRLLLAILQFLIDAVVYLAVLTLVAIGSSLLVIIGR